MFYGKQCSIHLAREDFVLKKIFCDERSFCTFTSDVMHHTKASSIGAFNKTAKVPRSISLAKRDGSYTILKLVTPMGRAHTETSLDIR